MMPYSAASDPFGDGKGGAGLGREMAWVLSLAGLFAIALLMIATTIYFASIRQDRTERINEERVVRASLDILARSLSGNVEDYANWDDAVRYLALQFDPTWARRNVGQSVTETLGYDISLVVDANEKVREVLDDLHSVVVGLRESGDELSTAAFGVKGELERSIVHFQFQDRVGQTLEHVRDCIEAIPVQVSRSIETGGRVPAPIDAEGLLQMLQSTYTMAEEHEVHSSGAPVDVHDTEITFF